MEITFSSLCQYLGANTATGRRNILKQQKYPTDGPMLSYVNAEQRIISHLVDGAPIDTAADPAHNREVLELFVAAKWPNKGLKFLRPSNTLPKLPIGRVELSLKPSVLVVDANGETGASKLFFKKPPSEDKPQLDDAVARKMASLLYYYGHEFLADATYSPRLCSVWCVRDQEVVQSTGRLSKLLDDVHAACAEIATLWDAL